MSVELASLSKQMVLRHDLVRLDNTEFEDQIRASLDSSSPEQVLSLKGFTERVLENYRNLRRHSKEFSPVKWLETCIECLFLEDGGTYSRVSYAGGKFVCGGRFVLPVGGVQRSVDGAWDQLLNRYRVVRGIFEKLANDASSV